MKWAPNTAIQPHLESPWQRLHNWLTLKLRNHFLFRRFNPENQSVNISMKSAPNTVIQPHLESHWPGLRNWLTLKLCKHFLFRKFDPENQSVDISMKLASGNSFQIRKYMSKHVQTPWQPSKNGILACFPYLELGFPSHNMYKHLTHLPEMVTLYFRKRQLLMIPSGDPIICTMGKYSKLASNWYPYHILPKRQWSVQWTYIYKH